MIAQKTGAKGRQRDEGCLDCRGGPGGIDGGADAFAARLDFALDRTRRRWRAHGDAAHWRGGLGRSGRAVSSPCAATLFSARLMTGWRKEWARVLGLGLVGWQHQNARPMTGTPRYMAQGGMAALAGRLADGLDVLTGRHVSRVDATEEGWIARDRAGGRQESRALLLTAPAPQSLELLSGSGVTLNDADYAELSRIRFGPCLCGVHEIEGEVALPEPGALQDFQSDIYWVADNRAQRHFVQRHRHQPRQRQVQPPKLGRARSRCLARDGVGSDALLVAWLGHQKHAA